jgi:hypothetical protein
MGPKRKANVDATDANNAPTSRSGSLAMEGSQTQEDNAKMDKLIKASNDQVSIQQSRLTSTHHI